MSSFASERQQRQKYEIYIAPRVFILSVSYTIRSTSPRGFGVVQSAQLF